ncbi:hypothetical protein CDFC105_93864 [Clostridioides difficile]|nr:hypothetical protein CDFC105_93864 [Clostridioides difficile]
MEIGRRRREKRKEKGEIEYDNFNFLFIAINIVRHTAYFATFPKSLDDDNIPNNVDMNTGILYLSIFDAHIKKAIPKGCLLYTSPSPRDRQKSRMPSSA